MKRTITITITETDAPERVRISMASEPPITSKNGPVTWGEKVAARMLMSVNHLVGQWEEPDPDNPGKFRAVKEPRP